MSEDIAEGGADCVETASCGLAQPMFEFGENLLDRVQIGRIFRQEKQPGASLADRLTDGFAPMTAEIVHDDDVAWMKRGDEHFLDIKQEPFAVDRAVEHARRIDTIPAQSGQKGHGLPVAMRNLGLQPSTPPRPSPERRHIGLGPGFIDENQA